MRTSNQMRTAGILATVLLALGGLATWDEWQTKRDDKKKETENLLLSLEVDKIIGIEFSNKEPKEPVDISMERSLGKWRITRPIKVLADQPAVDNLLTTLRDYKYEKVVSESDPDLASFGLDKPRRVIQLKTEKGSTTLLVGTNAPVGYSVYAMIEGSGKVHVGSQHLAVSTGKSLHDFRDKAILSVDSTKVSQIELIRPGHPALKIEKKDNVFSIVRPEVLPADQTAVRVFLDDIGRANATAFFDNPDEKLKKAFNGKVLAEVRLKSADDPVTNLKFIEKDKKIQAWLGGAEAIAELNDDIKGKLAKTASDFRDRKIFSFSGDKANEVTLDGKVFKKQNGDWFSADDATKGVPQIRSLLVDLEFAKATEILGLKDKIVTDSRETPPAHTLKISFDGSVPALEINIWEKKGTSESWILTQTEANAAKTVYVIGKTSLSAIEATKQPPTTPTLGHD